MHFVEPTSRPASPPGPRWRYPGQIMFAFRRGPLEFFQDLARRFGDVVRFKTFGTEFWLLNHPEHIRDVLVTHAERFEKGPVLKRAKSTLGEGLLTSEGELHRRQRRLAQPAFHPNRVATYVGSMTKFAAALGEQWRQTPDGRPRDVHPDMMGLALRIAAEALFGADVESQVATISRAMGVSIEMSRRAMSFYGPWLMRLPLPSTIRAKRARGQLLETVGRFIRDRRAATAAGESSPPISSRQDLLSMLLRAVDSEGDGRGMTDTLLRDEAITLFTAGHETTANALTFTWYLLARHPEALERLAAEADAALGPGDRLPTADDLPKLPYARAVFAESMRLYPPAWAVARTAMEPLDVGGYVIPKGAVVLMCQYVTHRDPRHWPEPEKFDPGRWLEEPATPKPEAERPRYAYYPFGGGPRNCIGEAFAWMEGVVILATLARQWRVELPPGTTDRPLELQPTITLRPTHGMPLVLRRRV